LPSSLRWFLTISATTESFIFQTFEIKEQGWAFMPDHLFCLCFEGCFFENRDNGVPNGFALSLTLSHGEREQMAGNHNNS